jgi:hypothetical protein
MIQVTTSLTRGASSTAVSRLRAMSTVWPIMALGGAPVGGSNMRLQRTNVS